MALSLEHRNKLLDYAWALEAKRAFQDLFAALSVLATEDVEAELELGCMLGLACYHTGNIGRGLELSRRLIEPARRRGNDLAARRILLGAGGALFETGSVAEAADLWLEVLEMASRAGDEARIAAASSNLAIVAQLRGQWAEAIVTYQRALAAEQRLGNSMVLSQIYNNIAMAYRDGGLYAKADGYFLRAMMYARMAGTEDDLGRMEFERALLLVLTGDLPLAAATAQRSLQRFERMGHRPGVGEALRVLGIIEAANGNRVKARGHLESSLAIARETTRPLLEGEVLEEIGALEFEAGEPERADAAFREAARIYRKLSATGKLRRLQERIQKLGSSGLKFDEVASAG